MKANIKDLRKYLDGVTLRGVVEILENLGSSQDPITYMGKETTPEELYYALDQRMSALDMRISFWGNLGGRKSFGLRRNSNFAQMILDRMNNRNN